MGALGFDSSAPYFSSAVLLLDCERWRREQLTDAAIRIAHHYGSALESADQDVLNILFHKAWLLIDTKLPTQEVRHRGGNRAVRW